ncbi:MAG: usg protein [Pseudomonadota bacterium]
MTGRTDKGFIEQLAGFSLTTAEILYRLPDHPSLLQTYVWQDYDQHPRFPKLKSFLDFWTENLDGKLFQVRVAHKGLIAPAEIAIIDGQYHLN